MSRLYASIDSDARKTQATSRGHKRIDAHVRGWDIGVRVVASVDGGNEDDVLRIFATSGSNGNRSDEFVAAISRRDDGTYRIEQP